jgi:polyisoprenoid-binding protein YceI
MSTLAETRTALPAGTWKVDPTHSQIEFAVEYMVGVFRGSFADVAAGLVANETDARLTGSARVDSIQVKDENLNAHLLSPEFFDAERHPELTFMSTEILRDGEHVTVAGDLTLKGVTHPVELTGTITDPIVDPYGRRRIGLDVATTVDRRTFGLEWNIPLPSGEPALANQVELRAELFFIEAA